MKFPNFNPDDAGDMDNESLDQLAINRTRELLKATVSSPDFSSAPELYLMIRMTVALAPSGIQPREAVEQALSGLSSAERDPLRNSLLKFYACEDDFVEAAKYLPKNGKLAISEYQPAMRVYLASGDLKAAKKLARRCQKLIPADPEADTLEAYDFSKHGLHMALAAYYARTDQRRKAMEYWQYRDVTGRYFTEVVTGVTFSLVVEALYAAHRGIDELLDEQVNEQFIFDAVSASDALDNRSQAVETLQAVRDALLKFLPPGQKARFGVDADARFKSLVGEEGR